MAAAETLTDGARPSIAAKALYGVGAMGEAAFTGSITFAFFYYTAALGYSGAAVGAALFLGLCADAVVDPFFGSWSDNIKSKLGRRIPLMLVGGPLLALSIGLLFAPPAGMPEAVMIVWLAGWAVAVRGFYSMFHVPYVALGAEMSGDYHERSSVVAWRTFFLLLGGVIVTGSAYSVFFKGPGGLQQAANYPAFGWFVAALVLGGCGLCALGSIRYASQLAGVPPVQAHLLARLPGEIREIFRNRSFRILFASAVLAYAGVGINSALTSHFYVFAWRLESSMIQTVTFVFLGGLALGVPLTPMLARALEKRTTVLIGVGLVVAAWVGVGVMWMSGMVGATGQDAVLPLCVGLAVAGLGAGICAIAYPSMMADAADEHEHTFARRREGLYFAGLGFAFKAGQGIGTLVSGVALDAIAFPKDAGRNRDLVLPDTMLDQLAFLWGPGPAVLGAAGMAVMVAYGISRRRHAEVAAALKLRREATPAE